MKTELLHSWSSASLGALARTDSSLSLDQFGGNSNFDPDGGGHPDRRHGREHARFDIGDSKKSNSFATMGQRVKSCCQELCVGQIFRRKTIERKFPIIKWLPQYTTDKLLADIIAGFTVGLTILPQGLAYATVGGLPPQYGLYSGFIGCFVYILLGGTREVTIGPTAVMAIITFTYTHGKPPAYAVILAFLTGIVTLLMGIFQLGFIVNFISTPVNSGFTSAAAITICSTQVKALLGLKFAAEGFLPTVKGAIQHIGDVQWWDFGLSCICIVSLLFLMKLQWICSPFAKGRPVIDKFLWFISTARNAILVIACTAIAASWPNQPFTIIRDIVPGLPDIKPPPFVIYDDSKNVTHSFVNILEEEGSAIIVLPLLAIMEHITIAKAFAGTNRIDASQEMISIGVSNLIGSFFSSMPITGSFSRTTVNAMSGAKSPLGGLITGTMVIVALRFLTPYFYFIPKASLASVIVCAVIFMVDLNLIMPMWRSKRMELVPWGLTFLVSLLVGLEFGMMTGFLISVTYLLYYAARPGVKVKKGYTTKGHEFLIVELDRSLTFPSVEYIRYVISKSSSSWGLQNQMPMVIDCLHIQFTDFTAAQGLTEVVKQFTARGQTILLWKVKSSFVRVLKGVTGECKHEDGSSMFVFCRKEEELEAAIDSRAVELVQNRCTVEITQDLLPVHTPHPEHRAPPNTNPGFISSNPNLKSI